MASERRDAQTQRPRVLLVEPDADLALATVHACLAVGLEPKLCLGPEKSGHCPGLNDHRCYVGATAEASLVAITSQAGSRSVPACVRGRLVTAADHPFSDSPPDAPAPEATLRYPYDPETAAALLAQIVLTARRELAWNLIRGTDPV